MVQAEFLAERVTLYSLLSRLFTYPLDIGVINAVAEISLREGLAKDREAAKEALLSMQKPLLEADDPGVLVETLNREATRLFEGPGKPIAPPYGSYYLNGKRLMGPESLEVRRVYLAAQMLPNPESHQHPDHLALELGFLAALIAVSGADAMNRLGDFIAQHILSWFAAWRDDVLVAKPHPFFAGLVSLTQIVLEEDLKWLNDHYPIFAPGITGETEDSK